MNLSKDELRTLVRDMVARHLERRPAAGAVPTPAGPDRPDGPVEPIERLLPPAERVQSTARAAQVEASHPSHVIIQVVGIDIDIYGDVAPGPCVIEPSVPCTHCGYCRSYGH